MNNLSTQLVMDRSCFLLSVYVVLRAECSCSSDAVMDSVIVSYYYVHLMVVICVVPSQEKKLANLECLQKQVVILQNAVKGMFHEHVQVSCA
jgi:NADH:ubiquinone oxidoreductase subunit 2 (subunit N)